MGMITMEDRYNKLSATILGKTRKKIVEKVYTLAFEYEQRYGSCPQCVLAAVQDVFGIVDDKVSKSGHPLAGGAGLMGDRTCGALLDGIIALGCKCG